MGSGRLRARLKAVDRQVDRGTPGVVRDVGGRTAHVAGAMHARRSQDSINKALVEGDGGHDRGQAGDGRVEANDLEGSDAAGEHSTGELGAPARQNTGPIKKFAARYLIVERLRL
jgi:hypothetical protein